MCSRPTDAEYKYTDLFAYLLTHDCLLRICRFCTDIG